MAAALVRARDRAIMATRSAGLLTAHRCASTKFGRAPARLEEVQRFLYQAEERYKPGGGLRPIPRITIDHVKISYASSGGGGQGFNKSINTKVDMRFKVKDALWLDEKVRERIMQMEKKRINKDGELVISSKKSKAQKSNAEDAIAKLQVFTYQKKKLQAIVDAASYAPPPPSEETAKKISEIATKTTKEKKLRQNQSPETLGPASIQIKAKSFSPS